MNIKTCRHCDMSFQRDDAAPIPHDRCERCHEEIEALVGPADVALCNKYEREIKPGVWVDVYSVLVAFEVTNPADAHAIKKMLMPGKRGSKGAIQDREEAITSLKRAIEIEREGF